jgi:hypothetical protein
VVLGHKQVAISIDRTALLERLAELDGTLALPCPSEALIEIRIEARALRCGKQVRMVLGEVNSATAPRTHEEPAGQPRWAGRLRLS